MADSYDAYVVQQDFHGRWIVDKVALPAILVRRGRFDPSLLEPVRHVHYSPIGRVVGINEDLAGQPNGSLPGRYFSQWRAVLLALAQAERLPVFARKLDTDSCPSGDFRKVVRSEPGEEFAFADEPTRIRVVVKKQGSLDDELKAVGRFRSDLWSHSRGEIDPNDPARAPRQGRDGRSNFEFETDVPDEVDRVASQYRHDGFLEINRLTAGGPEPQCQDRTLPSTSAAAAALQQPGMSGQSTSAAHGPSGV